MSPKRIPAVHGVAAFALIVSLIAATTLPIQASATTHSRDTHFTRLSSQYITDLTQLALDERIRDQHQFDCETIELIKVLRQSEGRHPLIIDQTNASPELVVEQLAVLIAHGQVPDSLKNKRILKLEVASMFSNAHSRAEIESVIESILQEMSAGKSENLLFVDRVTSILFSAKFAQLLNSGKLRIIGGSSSSEYREKIKTDSSLAAKFQVIDLDVGPSGSIPQASEASDAEYRGDNVSSDLRSSFLLAGAKTQARSLVDIVKI